MHGRWLSARWPDAPFLRFLGLLAWLLGALFFSTTAAQLAIDEVDLFGEPFEAEEFYNDALDFLGQRVEENDPTEYENFDPAEANPAENITCLGYSDIVLPVFSDWNPNDYSLQQLCAKPQFGGLGRRMHLGGFCYGSFGGLPAEEGGLGTILFDDQRASDPAYGLVHQRILLQCQNRCFCNDDAVTSDLSTKPKGYNLYSTGEGDISGERPAVAYQIKADLVDDFSQSFQVYDSLHSHERSLQPGTRFATIPVMLEFFVDDGWKQDSVILPVMLDPENRITCDGDLPSFDIPEPYTNEDFDSLQQMCATYLSGGNP